MNDDWDGVDWAENFSGPNDDEIERRQQLDFEFIQDLDENTAERKLAIFDNDDSNSVIFREGEFSTFETAHSYAKKSSAENDSIFRIERFNSYWKCYADHSHIRFDDELEKIRTDPPYLAAVELVEALRNSDRILANRILEGDVDVNSLGPALMAASYRGYADICERLLSLGATFEIEIAIARDDPRLSRDDDQDHENPIDTVMHRAYLSNDVSTIEVIAKAYVTAEWNFLKALLTKDALGFQDYCFTRLVKAAGLGMTGLCAEMICFGVDVNPKPQKETFLEYSNTPLLAAFENKHTSTCLVLLALGAYTSELKNDIERFGTFKMLFETMKSILDTSSMKEE